MSRLRVLGGFPVPVLFRDGPPDLSDGRFDVPMEEGPERLIYWYWRVRAWELHISIRVSFQSPGGTQTVIWEETVTAERNLFDETTLLYPDFGIPCYPFAFTSSTPTNNGETYLQHDGGLSVLSYIFDPTGATYQYPVLWRDSLYHSLLTSSIRVLTGTGLYATLESGPGPLSAMDLVIDGVRLPCHWASTPNELGHNFTSVTGTISMEPVCFFEYRGKDGQPIYDAATGAALIDPVTAPVP